MMLIHYIWFGRAIPALYLENILKLTSECQKEGYRIILWTDHVETINKTLWSLCEKTHYPGLEIKLIDDDLSPLFKTDPFYTPYKKNILEQMIRLEQAGHKNYATLSDFYRLEILYQFGGLYLDTDIEFLHREQTISMETLTIGIKFHADIKAGKKDHLQFRVNNDVLAANKGSEHLRNMIARLLYAYEELSKIAETRQGGHLNNFLFLNISGLDLKRNDKNKRFDYTLKCGPCIITDYLIHLKNEMFPTKNTIWAPVSLECKAQALRNLCFPLSLESNRETLSVGPLHFRAWNHHNWGVDLESSIDDISVENLRLKSPWSS